MPDHLIHQKREALEEALRDYLATANEGAYLTDYVIFVAGADPSNSAGTRYGFWASESPIHTIRGLITLGEEEICASSVSVYEDTDDAD